MGRGRPALTQEVKTARLIARLEKRIAELKTPKPVIVDITVPTTVETPKVE